MDRLTFFFLLSLLPISLFAQEHQYLNQQATIVENRVYKMIQYDALDSTGFIKEFPNGYYSIYSEEGAKIKSNAYRSYMGKDGVSTHEEYLNYYMYDSKGNQISMIQMFPEEDQPFRILSLKSISEDGESVQTVNLESDFVEDRFVFDEHSYSKKVKAFGDTIQLGKYHHRAHSSVDSTMYMDIFYAPDGLIDYTEFHTKCLGKRGSSNCSTKTTYTYDENQNILKKLIESYSNSKKTTPHLTREIQYRKDGLVNWIKTTYLNPDIDERTWFKFEYEFREEE